MGIQYFKVKVSRNLALPSTFNLNIHRLMKEKECRENGFGFADQWVFVGEMKGIDERNSMCIVAMLESEREPLQNKEEEKMWLDRIDNLVNPPINLPSTTSSV
jgi:hypothetical protein